VGTNCLALKNIRSIAGRFECPFVATVVVDLHGVMLQIHLVFILSPSKNDVAIKITIWLIINHY
jgi:hypothetical protein